MKRGADKNAYLKQPETKYIRDRLKYEYRDYAKSKNSCEVCGEENTEDNLTADGRASTGSLRVVFAYSLLLLWNKWKRDNGVVIQSEDQMKAAAADFIEAEREKLSVYWAMCDIHYKRIHSIYGKTIPLHYSKKLIRYVSIQQEKNK